LEGEDWLDAGKVFGGLSEKVEEEIRNRIDHWLGAHVFDKYHHGFPNDHKHDQVLVFKHQSLRLYGFLCNPKPKTDKGFRLCVLTEAASKHQWNTEMTILDRAMQMLNDLRVKEAIAVIYPEYGEVNTSWKN
jgi:hypothetical protein